MAIVGRGHGKTAQEMKRITVEDHSDNPGNSNVESKEDHMLQINAVVFS
ncbi:predicted protein [Sclerotinia sclerotiorum 1980 UF-70]|uniref:Uncharacterized protein n=1 Tax=Sclerotinia sclerotiorum (strain ATCC 18683 / 1980 / Ss-1) TaxID=665079 RepID=A7EEG7_SCLS1|nr:predicted protein [Sclerotinia sclerotiorum 1980 UF-70]EDO01233.1 predicted protein [Sclerotinia sclerotiorum 1980 UF-70]